MLRSHAPFSAGDVFENNWRLIRPLGDGSSSEVWLAYDQESRRDVAIKLLRAEHLRDTAMTDRFAMEGRALARVRHDNVVRMVARGVSRSRPFIVMEHVVGPSLSATLAALGGRGMPIGRSLAIMCAVLDGVAALHDAGVLHGDLEPSNVIIGEDRVVLVDLGLARPLSPACRLGGGVVSGTPRYLAPELVAGTAEAPSAATDVYAAATMAFELLTGRVPFVGGDVRDVMRAQIDAPIPIPSSLRTELPRALDRALLHGLAKAPARRTESVARLRAELLWATGCGKAATMSPSPSC
jgi:serine/threonine protein kinase